MVEILAAELKMDPKDIRLKNFVGSDAFPYTTATGLTYDSGNYAAPFEKALGIVKYKELREEQKKARAEGRLFGTGLSPSPAICPFHPPPPPPPRLPTRTT